MGAGLARDSGLSGDADLLAHRRGPALRQNHPAQCQQSTHQVYIASSSLSTTAAISAVINGNRLKNSVVRLGPKVFTECIHANGASIEASRQAYSTSGIFAQPRPALFENRNNGNSTTTATSTCKYSNTRGGRRNCHFFSSVL